MYGASAYSASIYGGGSSLSVPTTRIAGVAAATFVGAAVTTSDASVSGSTSTNLVSGAFKLASFSSFGGTTVGFLHANPNLNIAGVSAVAFTGGGILDSVAAIVASSDAIFERYYPPPMQGSTVFSPIGGGIVSTKFQGSCKLIPAFKGEYHAQIRAVFSGASKFNWHSESEHSAVAEIVSATTVFGKGAGVNESVAQFGATSTLSPFSAMVVGSTALSVGAAAGSFLGDHLVPCDFKCSGTSDTAFYGSSSFVMIPIIPEMADLIYVIAHENRVVASSG